MLRSSSLSGVRSRNANFSIRLRNASWKSLGGSPSTKKVLKVREPSKAPIVSLLARRERRRGRRDMLEKGRRPPEQAPVVVVMYRSGCLVVPEVVGIRV